MVGHHGINGARSSLLPTPFGKGDTVLVGADDKHVLNPESSDLSALYGFTARAPLNEVGDSCAYTPV